MGALEISKARSRPSHKGHEALQRGLHVAVDTAAQSSFRDLSVDLWVVGSVGVGSLTSTPYGDVGL